MLLLRAQRVDQLSEAGMLLRNGAAVDSVPALHIGRGRWPPLTLQNSMENSGFDFRPKIRQGVGATKIQTGLHTWP
jgi:hypothetical protein